MIVLILVAGIGYWRVSQAPLSLGFLRAPLESLIGSGLGDFSVRMSDAIVERTGNSAIRFSLADLTVLDEGSNVVARAPRATFSISLPALWDGRIVPSRLALIGPRMVLQRKGDGDVQLGFDVPEPGVAPGTDAEARETVASKTDAPPDPAKADAAASGGAASTGVEAVTDAGGKLIDFIVTALSSAQGEGGTTSYLQDISVRDAALTLFDEANGAIWFAPASNLVFQRVPGGVSFLTDARIGSEDDNWNLQLSAIYRKKDEQISVTAKVTDLVPASLARKVPILSAVAQMRTPLSGEVRLEVKRDGTVLDANATLTAKAGYVDFPGFISRPLLVDEGGIKLTYEPEDNTVILQDSTLFIGGIQSLLRGKFELVHGGDGKLETVRYNFAAKSLQTASVKPDDVVIDAFLLQGKADVADRRLDISSLYLKSGPAKILLAGALRDEGKAPAMRFKGKLSQVPFNLLKVLWPPAAAPGAREWLVENVQKAIVTEGTLDLNITSKALEGALGELPLPNEQLDLRFKLEGVQSKYLGELPPVQGAKAHGRLRGDSFVINVEEGFVEPGGGERMTISNGKMVVEKLGVKKPLADIVVQINGATAEAMRTIDFPPLGYATKFGLKPATVKGQSATTLRVRLPLINELKLEEVDIHAGTKLTGLNLPDMLGDADIDGGDLNVDVTKERMVATGKVSINGVPADLKWHEDFTGSSKYSSRFELKGKVDDWGRRRLGLDVSRFLSGPAPFTVKAVGIGSEVKSASIKADLTQATLMVDSIGWVKPPGQKAAADLAIDFSGRERKTFRKFNVKGRNIDVRGSLTLGDDHELEKIDLKTVKLGVNSMRIKGARRSDGVMAMTVTAKEYDARRKLSSMFKDLGTGDPPPVKSSPPTVVSAKVGTVYANNNVTLRNVASSTRLLNGQVTAMSLKGTFADGSPLEVSLASRQNRQRVLRVTSSNAGDVLRAIDLYGKTRGGQFRLDAELAAPGQNTGSTGVVQMRNFQISNDANLQAVARQTQRGKRRSDGALVFNSLRIPFAMRGNYLTIGNSYVKGPSIGAIAQGTINTGNEALNISGTFIPAYGLNSMFSNVPGIGPALMGGRGQGLFGITFGVGGTLSRPRFRINPVSALAPGFLRELFRLDGGGSFSPAGGSRRSRSGRNQAEQR